MSATPMTASLPMSILEHAGLTFRQLRLLLVLSALKNDCPGALYPSRDWLARRTRLMPNDVSNTGRALVEKGLLKRDQSCRRRFELVNPFEGSEA